MSDLQALRELIVKLCREDHVGLWLVVNHVREAFPRAETTELRQVTLGVLEELLERGLIRAGFPAPDGCGFATWSTTPVETITRIEDAWESLHRDPDIGEIVWFTALSQNAKDDS
jgi:hypothetical protein